jgi:hypothetical protein
MATFKFGRAIDLHWNGYDIQGPAETVFSIPDQLYEEFDADIAPVEPTLVWIDTNEFQTLENSVVTSTIVSSSYITTTSLTSGTQISIVSGSATSGYVLTANGSGGVSFQAAPGGSGSISNIIGTSPMSVLISSGSATVSIDQSAITGATSATNTEVLRSYVKNSSGSTITKGSVVYITGADGTNALIGLSSASTEATSSKTLGILASTLTNNAFGYVIKDGQLSNIDTSAASAGSSVWLGNTLGSYVFNAPPAEPSHSVYLGVVTKANVSTGEIVVKVQNGYELDELHDVSAGTPTDLDILQYKGSSALWTKASISNAGIAASSHTHAYQASGTYVNAVIGTSPASVSTSSGTSTVSILSGSINSTHLSATSVGSTQLIDQSVTTGKIGSGAAANLAVLTANGSGAASFLPLSIAGATVSTFTASGTYTKPSAASLFYVYAVGGGASGGGGARTTAAGGGGGGGGTGGAVTWRLFRSVDISTSTVAVTIGAGGIAVAGSSTTTWANGNNGNATTFGTNLLIAIGGNGNTTGSTGNGMGLPTYGTPLTYGEASNGNGYVRSGIYNPGSGGVGHDKASGSAGTAGQSGFGTNVGTNDATNTGNGGTLGTSGATPTAGGAGLTWGAGGGGGGRSTTTTTVAGGAGGDGALPGGGGGGGGVQGVTSATSNGGAGGAGGAGILFVIAW